MATSLAILLEIVGLVHVQGKALKAATHTESSTFESFLATHKRSLAPDTAEYEMRRKLYEERLHHVKRHNEHPGRLWTATVNKFSDRTDGELESFRGWRGVVSAAGQKKLGHQSHRRSGMFLSQSATTVLPDEKNWKHLNASQIDWDQGSCGSCWAVATAIALQAGAEIHGDQRSFSIQQLVSCVPNPQHCGGEGGCKGATVELAMQYVLENGLKTHEEWPYDASDSECNIDGLVQIPENSADENSVKLQEVLETGVHQHKTRSSPAASFGMVAWERLPSNKYQPLMIALSEHGPVAVSVAASAWFGYSSGIFNGCDRDAVVDHAVTLIGYGNENGAKYWNIKNSWSNEWGEAGNIRLLRREDDDTAQCGVDRQPEVGTGCEGGPTEVTVCGMCGILYDSVVPYFAAPSFISHVRK